MGKKAFFRLFASLISAGFLILSLSSCVTTGGSKAVAPDWVDSQPVDEAFYIGVGSSKTGNESQDRETAKARAVANLAAAISTRIQGELTIAASEDSSGNRYEVATELVSQSVEQNLKDYETAGTYYEKTRGAWVYVRLSKKAWEEMQKREMAELTERVRKLIAPALEDASVGVASKLATLWKAYEVTSGSPYALLVKAEIAGVSGNLIDVVEKHMAALVEDISLSVEPANLSTETGRPLDLTIIVKSKAGRKPGQFPVVLVKKDGSPAVSVKTGQDGIFADRVDVKALPLGKNELKAVIDFKDMGIDLTALKTIVSPVKNILVDVQQIRAGLAIETPTGITVPGLDGMVRSLFSAGNLPFKLSADSSDTTFVIRFSLKVTDFPKLMQDAPDMAQALAVVSVERDGRSLYSYESPAVKDGGINANQAHERAVKKLFDELKKQNQMIQGMSGVLSFD